MLVSLSAVICYLMCVTVSGRISVQQSEFSVLTSYDLVLQYTIITGKRVIQTQLTLHYEDESPQPQC